MLVYSPSAWRGMKGSPNNHNWLVSPESLVCPQNKLVQSRRIGEASTRLRNWA